MIGFVQISQQVASFCRTTSARRQAAQPPYLPQAQTKEDAKKLYAAATATANLPLDFARLEDFDGNRTIQDAVQFANDAKGKTRDDTHEPVDGATLARIASALEAASAIAKVAKQAADEGDESAKCLLELAEDALNAASEFRRDAAKSLDTFGAIVDNATEALADARDARRAATAALRDESKRCIAELRDSGALADGASAVVYRQGRACVLVKAGRKPKGSVVLANSKSGAQQFVEPPELMACNDALIEAESAADAEELRVLVNLNRALASDSQSARASLEAAARVDLACARAQHAAWTGGVVPRLDAGEDEPLLQLSGVFHPELLALRALPALPAHAVSMLPTEMEKATAARTKHRAEAASPTTPSCDRVAALREASSAALAEHTSLDRSAQCIPIDVEVLRECRSVVLTGPNAGGKTAVLRTIGVSCACARAGVFLPTNGNQPTPIVPWFDSIFADIGDAQSLTQSLSTFGGAVKRWAGILDALDGMPSSTSSTEASESVPALVLLDEIGMGTDPNEGASLAVSLLERLAAMGGARLSVCTTHHAACARLASERDDFVPAAMRYDANTLQPTYELIWNAIGESRALDVAKRCGMPPSVLEDAERRLVGSRGIEAEALGGERFTASLVASLSASASAMAEKARAASTARERAEALYAAVSSESLSVQEHRQRVEALEGADEARVARQLEEARRMLSSAASELAARIASGSITATEAERAMNAHFDEASERLWLTAEGSTLNVERRTSGGDVWRPSRGDLVRVRTMQNKLGVVEQIDEEKQEDQDEDFSRWQLQVRVGALVVSCTSLDVEPPNWSRRAANVDGEGTMQLSYREYREQLNAQASRGSKRRRSRGSNGGRSSRGGSDVVTQGQRLPFMRSEKNTLDVRGLTADELSSRLSDALTGAPRGGYLFVIHGFGDEGVLLRLTRRTMDRHPRVLKWEVDEDGAGGSTVAWIK